MHPSLRTGKISAIGRIGGSNLSVPMVTKSGKKKLFEIGNGLTFRFRV